MNRFYKAGICILLCLGMMLACCACSNEKKTVSEKELMQQGDYDVVHLSAVPKMFFTSITYTVAEAGNGCSHPLMTVGKVVPRGERLVFPLSIYVNHAFVDGSHLASFFGKIEKYLKEV